jgi:hypothetical protein
VDDLVVETAFWLIDFGGLEVLNQNVQQRKDGGQRRASGLTANILDHKARSSL